MPMVTPRLAIEACRVDPTALALAMALRTSSSGYAHGGEPRRIDADANGRLFGAGDGDIGDAVDLRQALGDHGIGGVVDLAWQHGFRGQRQDQDRRRRRIGLAERRQRRQVAGQVAERGVERRLHVARGAFDAAAQDRTGR